MDKLIFFKLTRLLLTIGKSEENISAIQKIFKLIKKSVKSSEKVEVDQEWHEFCQNVGIEKSDLG